MNDVLLFERVRAFLAELPGIATASDLAAATIRVSAPLGLTTVMAGAILVRGNHVAGRFYFGNWSTEWKSTYLESIFAEDPLVHEARRRMGSFTWRELWDEGDLPQSVRELIELGRQRGWTDGLAVPIHGPGGYVALVSFAGGALELSATERALLQAVAHAGHQRGRQLYRHGDAAQGSEPRLSSRELQVMHWVARGKRDTEIAGILKLSVTTVHGYVEQAKRKLGVRSRTQAVSELALREMLLRDV